MIASAGRGLDKGDQLVPVVQSLGVRHSGYGVEAGHYDTVGGALIKTLGQGLGDEFTDEVREAWVAAYGLLAQTMIEAAEAKVA